MAHSHDHHYTETKPVAFTVPFILAAVLLVAIGLFLSLCDPEPHGHHNAATGHGQHGAATSNDGHHNATDKDMQTHGEAKGPEAAQQPASH
jgi:hypothetical protein